MRSVTSNGTVTKDFLYDLGGRIITEMSGTGSINRQEVFAGGRHLAIFSGASAVYFANSDWQGTERVRSTKTGTLDSSYSNLPFGDLLNSVGESPKHFTDKERDAETGLDYFGARYYGSSMGRFTSPDPKMFSRQRMFDPQQWNMYQYSRNNPLRYVDDDGEEVKETATTVYYHVNGSTAAEAWNNAPAASGIPGGYRGNTETNMGVGDYKFSYTYTTTPSSATVTDTLTSADVNLTVTTTLPTWDGYSTASASEKSQWDQLSGSLNDHEQGHKEIAEQGANALDKSLPGTQATGTGKTLPDAQNSANTALGDKVQQKQQGAVNSTQAQQNAYDQRTDHGQKPDPQKKPD